MNIDNIRYLSFDLDGTLLNNQGKISSYTESVIKRLQQKGCTIILNSGRFYHELDCFIDQLELHSYGGYAVCSNGYRIYDAKNECFTCNSGISTTETEFLFSLIKQHFVFTFLHYHNTYYIYSNRTFYILLSIAKRFAQISLPYPKRIQRYIHMFRKVTFRSYQQHNMQQELEKMCLIGPSISIKHVFSQIHQHSDAYHFFNINAYSSEIAKKGVSKADAVHYIVNIKHDTMKSVMAFGDAGNDILLLQQAGIGVCMKNAKKDMYIHTPYITSYSNEEDGVAKYLEEHFLKE